jgi:hypothetical protein
VEGKEDCMYVCLTCYNNPTVKLDKCIVMGQRSGPGNVSHHLRRVHGVEPKGGSSRGRTSHLTSFSQHPYLHRHSRLSHPIPGLLPLLPNLLPDLHQASNRKLKSVQETSQGSQGSPIVLAKSVLLVPLSAARMLFFQ